MSQELNKVPPANCRQQLAADGKPYPRSSCAACGQFSPRLKECDAMIAASPVPPAGDVEVLGYCWKTWKDYEPQVGPTVSSGGSKPDFVLELVDRAHVTRLTAEKARLKRVEKALAHSLALANQQCVDLVTERDALKAQVETLKAAKGDPVGSFDKHLQYMSENAALQSERNKAREVEVNIRRAIADRECYLGDPKTLQANREKYQREVEWLNCFLAHQPEPAAPTCCVPSAEDLALIQAGDYCAEELWGGPRPTCPKCIDHWNRVDHGAPAAKGET